jgi:hypothetical protein
MEQSVCLRTAEQFSGGVLKRISYGSVKIHDDGRNALLLLFWQ